MGLLRAFSYWAIVGAILVGSPYFGPDGRVPSFGRGYAEAAPALQESPTVEPTSTLPSAPTPTVTVNPPAATATSTASIVEATQTPTPVATGTPTPTNTPDGSTPTPTPTATESVTPTATPDPEGIPAVPDPIGTTTELQVGTNGGTLATADGRVTLVVPANAVASDANFKVTSRANVDFPGLDSHRLIAVYELTATDVATGLEITTFPADLSLTLHFSSNQMSNLLADSVRLWSFEPITRTWVEVAAGANHSGTRVTNTISHFSMYGGSGDPAISQGPFTVDFNTTLHSGSATGAIPIEVPAGPGGLTPQLVLNYDSNRVNDMKEGTSLGSWVGTGWSLSTGQITKEPHQEFPYVGGVDRAYLELGGVGGEMTLTNCSPCTPAGSVVNFWKLKQTNYWDIREYMYTGGTSRWEVKDHSGRTYIFGDSDNSRRFFTSQTQISRQYDLAKIVDARITNTSYNTIYFTYTQIGSTGSVKDAFPSEIRYGGSQSAGRYRVRFENHALGIYTSPNSRPDNPTGTTCGSTTLPVVMETRALKQVTVEVDTTGAGGWNTLRKYEFAYTTEPHPTNPTCLAGIHQLNTVSVYGVGGSALFRTYAFIYSKATGTPPPPPPTALSSCSDNLAPCAFRYCTSFAVSYSPGLCQTSSVRPFLTRLDNGFGGSVSYTYQELWSAKTTPADFGDVPAAPYVSAWTRVVVASKTVSSGSSSTGPAMTTTYDYRLRGFPDLSGPSQDRYGWRSDLTHRSAAFLGFGDVKEIDASGNEVQHLYFTNGYLGNPDGGQTHEGGDDEIRTGRESKTVIRDSSSVEWSKVERTWAWDHEGGICYPNGFVIGSLRDCAAFIYLSETNTYPKGYLTTGGQTRETYTYDLNTASGSPLPPPNGFGQLLTATYHGVSTSALDDRRTEYTYFEPATWTDPFLVLPKTVKVVDPNTSAVLRSTINYYDNRCDHALLPTRGLLTSTSTQVDAAPAPWANVHTGYDGFGNRAEQTIPTTAACVTTGLPAGVPKTTWTFDPAFPALLSSEANAMPTPQVTTYTYDAAANGTLLGKPTKVAPPDGHWVETRYDAFGRPDRSWDILDSDAYPTEKYTYTWGSSGSNKTKVLRRVSPGAAGTTRPHVACQDGLGRVFMTLAPYGPTTDWAKNAEVRTDYDARGNKAAVSNPVNYPLSDICDTTAISTLDRTIFGYDTLGNTSVTTFLAANQLFGGVSRKLEYNGISSNRINENDHRVVETLDLAVNPNQTKVIEQTGNGTTFPWADYSTTKYKRDRLGQLEQVVDNDGNTTTLTYDMGGRKRTMSDPDMGNWSYTYDVRGNLLTQTDARGVVTTLAYDSLDRLTQKTYSNDPNPAQFFYDNYGSQFAGLVMCAGVSGAVIDAVGQLTGTRFGSTNNLYHCYDNRMRVLQSRRDLGSGATYDIKQTFNGLNEPKTITYPDNEVLTYGYDALGNLATLAAGADTIFSAIWLDPSMRPASHMNPNGQTMTYYYDYRMRVTTIVAVGVQQFNYTYDNASNVKTLYDGNGGQTTTFTYDDLERLTGASGGGYTAGYNYTPIGNLTQKNEAQAVSLGYPAPGQPKPHAANYVLFGGTGGPITYDNNGNMLTSITGETFTYDAENRVKTRYTGGSLGLTYTYTYGAGGELVQRVETGGAQTKTVTYVGGIYEKEVVTGGATTITKYYQAFGRAVAVRKGGALSYLYADHLGSTTAAWAVATSTLTSQRYWPYGATRTGGLAQTDKLYTGQQQEQADYLGLYNYKARFYSTTLGRFVSADPRTTDGLNRYAYVRNNSLKNIDPSGFDCISVTNLDPRDCDDFLKDLSRDAQGASNIVVDGGRSTAGYLYESAQAAWTYLGQRVRQLEAAATAVSNFAQTLTGSLQTFWRATYPIRAAETMRIELAVLAAVIPQAIYNPLSLRASFNIVYPVSIVVGCNGPICDSVRGGDSRAFTIGHTVFTWMTLRDIEEYGQMVFLWDVLAHEFEHVAQFEDLGDLFWVTWLGGGAFEVLMQCREGCNLVDAWHDQWLESSAEDGSYPTN